MNEAEARAILSVYRPGESKAADARFEEAGRFLQTHPEVAQWWAEQEELDRLISSKLESTPVPADLRTRLTAWEQRAVRRTSRNRATMLLAASIVAAAVMFSSWRGPFQPQVSLGDFREEMVSFIKLDPSLELESGPLTRVQEFLAQAKAPAQWTLPEKLKPLEPLGCRVLRFRGRNVSLVCFARTEEKLIHLFVIDAAALPRSDAPEFAQEGEWITVTWTQGDHAFLMTLQGDRALAEKYISSS